MECGGLDAVPHSLDSILAGRRSPCKVFSRSGFPVFGNLNSLQVERVEERLEREAYRVLRRLCIKTFLQGGSWIWLTTGITYGWPLELLEEILKSTHTWTAILETEFQ